MSVTIWLSANTLHYPQGGGHMWVFLNWALGLRELGCEVVWLEGIVKDYQTGPGAPRGPAEGQEPRFATLAPSTA